MDDVRSADQPTARRGARVRRTGDDRGQAVPLVLVVVVLAVVATLGIAHLGRSVIDAGRARTAADAAALAGVEGGRAASSRLAAEHGGELVSWSTAGGGRQVTVTVTVRVGRARATAAASNEMAGGATPARARDS
jgi:Tfp pilus assembly protein PilV